MGRPPVDDGASQPRAACPSLATAVTFKGVPGTVKGTIAADGEDEEPNPAAFIAVTVKEYETPLVRPVMVVAVSAWAPVTTMWSSGDELGEETTEYSVMGLPPVDDGASQLTAACPLVATAVTFKGASGTVKGVTVPDAEDGEPVPVAFSAVTVKK